MIDSREREGAQFQVKINSLENEVTCLMDDIARMRRNQSSLGSGGGYGGGYSVSSTSSVSSAPSYPVPTSYIPDRTQPSNPFGPSSIPSTVNSTYATSKTSSLGSLADDGGYSLSDRGIRPSLDAERTKHQPRSLRGVLEQDHQMEPVSGIKIVKSHLILVHL